MNKEHDRVVLTVPLPSEGLKVGDIGTVVHIHQGGAAYEVEFMTLAGETIAVTTLSAAQARPLGRRDMAHARELSILRRSSPSKEFELLRLLQCG